MASTAICPFSPDLAVPDPVVISGVLFLLGGLIGGALVAFLLARSGRRKAPRNTAAMTSGRHRCRPTR